MTRLRSTGTGCLMGLMLFVLPAGGFPRGGLAAEVKGAGPASPASQEKVRLTVSSISFSFIALYLAMENGFYQAQGLTPLLITARPDIGIKALISGDVDYTHLLGSTVRAALGGAPVKVMSIYLDKTDFYLVAQPGIKSAQELKGKRVAVSSFGATSDVAARRGLRHLGLDPEREVTILQIGGNATRLAALKAGTVEATVLSPPINSIAREAGFPELLFIGDLMSTPFGGLGTNNRKIREQPEQIKKVLRAELTALRYIRNDREGMIRDIMKIWQLNRRVATLAYESVLKTASRNGGDSEEQLRVEVEDARQRMQVKGEVRLSQVADFRLLKQVQREMGF